MKKILYFILWIVFVLSVGAVYYCLDDYLSYKKGIISNTKQGLITLTRKAAKSIDGILRDAVKAADDIAHDFDDGKINRETMLERLQKSLLQNPYFYSGTITYKPYGFDPGKRLYSCFFITEGDSLKYVQLDESYDYTDPKDEWYGKAMEKGAHWSEPYYDSVAAVSMTTYSSVFHEWDSLDQEWAPLGVVTIDITLEGMKQIIESLDLGAGGFGALLSKKGIYLYHPQKEYVIDGKSIKEVGREKHDPRRIMLSDRIVQGADGTLDHVSTTTGLESWLVYEPVPLTGWSLQNTFIKDDVSLDFDVLRQQLMRIILAVVVCLLLFAVLTSFMFRESQRRAWWVSVSGSVLFLASVCVIWHLAVSYQSQLRGGGTGIFSRATLKKYKNDLNVVKRKPGSIPAAPPVYVPTGIFVESLKFVEANDLMVIGYIWQKYHKGLHKGISRGVFLSRTESLKLEDISPQGQANDDIEIIRWAFKATMRTRLKYTRYPLDQEKIGIRLLHRDLKENVILVPDLAAYPIINPTSHPGLEKDLVLPGWRVMKSFFELRKEAYNTDFGDGERLGGDSHNLYFNIIIRRNFLDSFISNLTPLIVVAFLLFARLYITTADSEMIKKLDIAAGKTLAFCAGLFFVVVFSHIGIRQRILAEEIFYLEYFYLIMYFCLLWIPVNSILFNLGKKLTLIQYRDNFIAKVTFWPGLLGLLAAVTFIIFY